MVEYAVPEKPWGRWKRRQNMFASLKAAEAFLQEAKREFQSTRRVDLAGNRALHNDVLRALKILSEVRGASFESAAWLFKTCQSAKEMRGAQYEVPENRVVELDPRAFCGCMNEARRRGIRIEDLIKGIVWTWLEREASGRKEEAEAIKARNLAAKRTAGWKSWRERRALAAKEVRMREYREQCEKLEAAWKKVRGNGKANHNGSAAEED
jgi:hypothetical protein